MRRPERRFYFRLALALGTTVDELLRRISSRELSEWAAFFSLEPWGTEVEDWRAGLIAAMIANATRDPKYRSRPYEPADFMPRRQPQAEEQSWEEQAKILEMWGKVWEQRFGDQKRGES